MQGGLYADCQEWYLKAAKLSNMVCAALLCGPFADARELSIQAANISGICSAVSQ